MGREVRRVAKNWEHPKDKDGNYIPLLEDQMRTHYQMYETCTEGTPISPVMETPEELARWLVDNHASAFGHMEASYEAWLRVCKGGWACSAVAMPGIGIVSGVEGIKDEND